MKTVKSIKSKIKTKRKSSGWKRGFLPEFGKKVAASLDSVFGKEEKYRLR